MDHGGPDLGTGGPPKHSLCSSIIKKLEQIISILKHLISEHRDPFVTSYPGYSTLDMPENEKVFRMGEGFVVPYIMKTFPKTKGDYRSVTDHQLTSHVELLIPYNEESTWQMS